MNELFGLGSVGAGSVVMDRPLSAAITCLLVTPTALVDTNLQQCRLVSSQITIKQKLTTSVKQIQGNVDGVIIATPNHTHRRMAMECLRAGGPPLMTAMANPVADCNAIRLPYLGPPAWSEGFFLRDFSSIHPIRSVRKFMKPATPGTFPVREWN